MATAPPVGAPRSTSTRERLLAAAVEVFVEQGYEGARVQDIARAAGLTTGAIYANFRGKGDLLFDAIGARADAELGVLLTSGREARELLEVLGDRLLQRGRQAPLLIDAIAAARRDEELARALRERLRARENVIAQLVERAQEEGTIDESLDAATLGRFCSTLALGALVMRTLDTTPPDGDAWHRLISRLLDAICEENLDE